MDRMIDAGLRTALLLAAIGSLLSLVRMIAALIVPISYYWWGAVAFVVATLVLAAAIHLREAAPAPAAK